MGKAIERGYGLIICVDLCKKEQMFDVALLIYNEDVFRLFQFYHVFSGHF